MRLSRPSSADSGRVRAFRLPHWPAIPSHADCTNLLGHLLFTDSVGEVVARCDDDVLDAVVVAVLREIRVAGSERDHERIELRLIEGPQLFGRCDRRGGGFVGLVLPWSPASPSTSASSCRCCRRCRLRTPVSVSTAPAPTSAVAMIFFIGIAFQLGDCVWDPAESYCSDRVDGKNCCSYRRAASSSTAGWIRAKGRKCVTSGSRSRL